MILHRQLKALLHRLGLDEEQPPDEDHWLALLVLLNDRFRQFEEDRHRLQRSLDIHSREVQSLYQELTQERDKVSSALASVESALILLDAQGKALLISAEGENLIGYAEHELEGKEVFPLLGLDRILPDGGLTRLLQGLRPVEVDVPLRTRHGVEETRLRLQPLIRERQLIGCLMQFSDPAPVPESYEPVEATQEELVPVPALLEVEPDPPQAPPPAKPKERPLHVLLIESDGAFAQAMLAQLRELQHEVVHVEEAGEGLKAYYERHFDAILCCEQPKGFAGVELCKKLRQDTRGSYPYFILMTPAAARQNAKQALEAGVDAFLNKPLEPVELQVRLKVARGVQSRLNRAYPTLMSPPQA
ncbi:MAG: response regulator [Candidatus Eremiobacteraeota bacterium]|nr:response regulator [Candidatus Eremiobacteraeota bacterium]MCW5866714.1 response regulator [Candidatus Eremiobacteraeota bacterium]